MLSRLLLVRFSLQKPTRVANLITGSSSDRTCASLFYAQFNLDGGQSAAGAEQFAKHGLAYKTHSLQRTVATVHGDEDKLLGHRSLHLRQICWTFHCAAPSLWLNFFASLLCLEIDRRVWDAITEVAVLS